MFEPMTISPDGLKKPRSSFRVAVLRGLAVLAPPLLTVLIFIWVGNTVNEYVVKPVSYYACEGLVYGVADIRSNLPGSGPVVEWEGRDYRRMSGNRFVPVSVYEIVEHYDPTKRPPEGADALYRRFVEIQYLQPYYVVPFVVVVFVLLLYLAGKFMAANIGRVFWHMVDAGFNHVPLVGNVYSGVKQVSDFMFKENEFRFMRVVAVEYPRRGMWSVGFVTSESLPEIRGAASEPIVAVFIPCSPMPLTGFTANCLQSECIDLDMTFDQACQFLISCGVIIPPDKLPPSAAMISPGQSAAPVKIHSAS